jgi:hypothetical protein
MASAAARTTTGRACGMLSPVGQARQVVRPSRRETLMPDDFEYVSRTRLEFRDGYRHAFLGDVPEPVVYGVQGKLREYYGVKECPPIASTLDHIVAAVAG